MSRILLLVGLLATACLGGATIGAEVLHGVVDGPEVILGITRMSGVETNQTVGYTGAFAAIDLSGGADTFTFRVYLGQERLDDGEYEIAVTSGTFFVYIVLAANDPAPLVRILGDSQTVEDSIGVAATSATTPVRVVHGAFEVGPVNPFVLAESVYGSTERMLFTEAVATLSISDYGFILADNLLTGYSFGIAPTIAEELPDGIPATSITTFAALTNLTGAVSFLRLTAGFTRNPQTITEPTVTLLHGAPMVGDVDVVLGRAVATPVLLGLPFMGSFTVGAFPQPSEVAAYVAGENPPTTPVLADTLVAGLDADSANFKHTAVVVNDGGAGGVRINEDIPTNTDPDDFNIEVSYANFVVNDGGDGSATVTRTGTSVTRTVDEDLAAEESTSYRPLFAYPALMLTSFDITVNVGAKSGSIQIDTTTDGPGLAYSLYAVDYPASENLTLILVLDVNNTAGQGTPGEPSNLAVVHGDEFNGGVMVVLQRSLDAPVVLGSQFNFGDILQLPVFEGIMYNIRTYVGGMLGQNADLTFDSPSSNVVAVAIDADDEGEIRIFALADGEGGNAAPANGNTHVRFIHAAPQADMVEVDVRPQGTESNIFGGQEFREGSNYAPIPVGEGYLLEAVNATGAVIPVTGLDAPIDINIAGGLYAAVAIGGNATTDVTAVFIAEATRADRQADATGTAFVKVLHLYEVLDDMDPVLLSLNGVTVPELMPLGNTPIVFNQTSDLLNSFDDVTHGFISVPATSDLDFQIYLANTVGPGIAPAISTGPLTLEDGVYYTVAAVGVAVGDPIIAITANNDVSDLVNPEVLNANQINLRFGHFAIGIGAVNVTAGGVELANNLTFPGVSAYQTISSDGPISIVVDVTDVGQVPVEITLEDQRVYSLYAYLDPAGGADFVVVFERDLGTDPPSPGPDYDYDDDDAASLVKISISLLLAALLSLLA